MNRLPVFAALSLASCSLGLERDPPQRARFLLEARRPDIAPTAPPAPVHVEVRGFHAASAFASARFVYRTDGDRWETDFYREFLIRPELAIADSARTWLADADLAVTVLAPGSQVTPTHVLEGDVIALYGDFRDRDAPRAVLELRIMLVDLGDGAAVRQWQYAEQEQLATAEPDLLPAAWNAALHRALSAVEADLRSAL